ncbi:unnamed protein product [Anisakis simplex]|uniref:Uncharacterized protein n=1 Tax=Anisakis simplex TaxID=6269 RepID=A0A0M3KJ93_ANISI|nr:unnamed protein product [Anisakis simplex]
MTVAAILSAMGIRPAVFPLYASLVLIELHKHSGGPFTVKLFYKNVTDSPALFEFPIEGCAKPCTLDSFISRSQKYIPDDWKRECGLKESNPESILTNAYNKGVILSLSISTAILSMIMAVSLLKKYLERQRRYEGRVRLSTSEQSCDTLT